MNWLTRKDLPLHVEAHAADSPDGWVPPSIKQKMEAYSAVVAEQERLSGRLDRGTEIRFMTAYVDYQIGCRYTPHRTKKQPFISKVFGEHNRPEPELLL